MHAYVPEDHEFTQVPEKKGFKSNLNYAVRLQKNLPQIHILNPQTKSDFFTGIRIDWKQLSLLTLLK